MALTEERCLWVVRYSFFPELPELLYLEMRLSWSVRLQGVEQWGLQDRPEQTELWLWLDSERLTWFYLHLGRRFVP